MIVVDTNVVAYLTIPSPHTPLAERLRLTDPDWVVPPLWRSEMRNILALYIRKSMIAFDAAVAVQRHAETVVGRNEYGVASPEVLTLVRDSPCSAYDCEFVAGRGILA